MEKPPRLASTTVTGTADASNSDSGAAELFYVLVLVGSSTESHRLGQAGFLWPGEELCIGRGDDKHKYVKLGFHRPGEPLVVIPGQEFLAGEKMSRLQLRFKTTSEGVMMKKVGRRATYLNAKDIGEEWILLKEGDLIHVAKQVLMRLGRRPKVLPPQVRTRKLQPFGEADEVGRVGESYNAWVDRRAVDVAASRSGEHILIYGETGTGKELAAAAIHKRSKRAHGPFVAINAAGIPRQLIDAELFGIKGGFLDGRSTMSNGVVGDSDKGTLFLDEIGECPGDTQTSLLRMLETRTYRRVGESIARPVDVRVVGATHQGDKAFRKDFRGRFQIVIELHSLDDRRDDLVLIARFLLVDMVRVKDAPEDLDAEVNQELRERLFFQGPSGKLAPRMSLFLLEYLMLHPLKRNTRELREILLKALLSSTGEEITLPGVDKVIAAPSAEPGGDDGGGPMREIGKEELLLALQTTGNNKTQAAKLLRIGRTGFYALMARHGMKVGSDSTE